MKEIYLDHAATTAALPEALAAYVKGIANCGNPSSLHSAGVRAKSALEAARAEVANAFGVTAKEIIFTSGGSESNNAAIRGAYKTHCRRGKRIILSAGEHPSVENPARALAEEYGAEIVFIPTRGGILDTDVLTEALSVPTALVCVMLANNESGAIYDIAAVRRAIDASGTGAHFHCDAVQGFLKCGEYRQIKDYCDTASVSAHKVGGVRGVGALYVKNGVRLPPFILGGGQEGGLRSGTEDLPGICAFAEACKLHGGVKDEEIKALREAFIKTLSEECPFAVFHIPPKHVEPILSVSFPGVKSEVLLNAASAEGIYISAGSACSAARKGASRVMEAYGLPNAELESAVRVSFGAGDTAEECVYAAKRLAENAKRLKR
ncbi:MAG: cysteine desulfurase [Clostridia bacterium]|nr:cysteine desulfurase [Clostridia bacterium]